MSTLIVTGSGSGQTSVGSGSSLVSSVATIVGGVDENTVRAQALDCLNRVRTLMNKRDWKYTKTTASPITLVAGTSTYTLPSAFKRPSFARLLDTNSKPDADLVYQDDAWLNHQFPDQESTGKPVYYLLRNTYDDGSITVFPTPTAGDVTSWTLSVEYFGRMTTITDDITPIDLPEEVSDVLVLGAQYCICKERGDIAKAQLSRADYYEALGLLVAHDRRITDENSRIRLGRSMAPFGTVYIRA